MTAQAFSPERSIMRVLTMSLFVLLSGLIASPAFAIDIGECGTPEQMTAKFKAEDQHSIASANLFTRDKQMFGMIFTMNTDRSVGYILKSDQPTGDKANKLCVYNRMANVRLYDANKPGIPPEQLLKAPESDALRRCDELAKEGKLPRESCGSLNTMIHRSEPSGDRVILQGFSVDKQPDGSYKPATAFMTITGNVSGSIYDDPKDPALKIIGSILYSSLPDGATIINATLVYARYTEYGLKMLQ